MGGPVCYPLRQVLYQDLWLGGSGAVLEAQTKFISSALGPQWARIEAQAGTLDFARRKFYGT